MTKTLNQIIFLFLHQHQNNFFSNIGNQNIFLGKNHNPPFKLNGRSLKDDNVDSNIFKDGNDKENKMLNDLSTELGQTICPQKQLLLDSLSKLEGTYVKKTDNSFTCIHKNVFNIIAFCVGSSIIRTIIKHGSSWFIKKRLQFKSLNVQHDSLTIMLLPEKEEIYFQRLLIDIKYIPGV